MFARTLEISLPSANGQALIQFPHYGIINPNQLCLNQYIRKTIAENAGIDFNGTLPKRLKNREDSFFRQSLYDVLRRIAEAQQSDKESMQGEINLAKNLLGFFN